MRNDATREGGSEGWGRKDSSMGPGRVKVMTVMAIKVMVMKVMIKLLM